MHRPPTVRAVVACLALLTAALLAGCSGGGGSGSGSSAPGPASGSASSSSAGSIEKGVDNAPVTTSAPVPASTGVTAPSTPAGTPPAGLRDFTDLTFSVPSGFAVTTAYSPITPLESGYRTHYVAPTAASDTKEVIGMIVYTLPAAGTVTSRTDQLALIKAYNIKAKAVASASGIRRAASTIDGLPAYTETATETGNAGTVTYIAYWAFGTHHFLQYSCQLGATNGVAALAVACGTTLASLKLT